jgi:hypothetical protein
MVLARELDIPPQLLGDGKAMPFAHSSDSSHGPCCWLRIFFIGGGFGSEYVQTIHILDTDAPPKPTIRSEPLTLRIQVPSLPPPFFPSDLRCAFFLYQSQLKTLFNSEELSDVIFLFPGDRVGEHKRIFGHRILLSLMCDRLPPRFSSFSPSHELLSPLGVADSEPCSQMAIENLSNWRSL